MNSTVQEVQQIIFGIFSTQEIINMSVCKVDSTKLSGPNTIYDERMGGSLETAKDCVTCGLSPKDCWGHFGHIEFNECIINPLYYKMTLSFLRCFCIDCHKLLIMKDQIALWGLTKLKQERRFNKILKNLDKVDICCHCSHPQPKFSYSPTDNTISMMYKEKVTQEDETEKGPKKDQKISISMIVDDIKKIFDDFSREDIESCGFDPDRMQPANLIMSAMPVLPPAARPFVIADGNICDDDLSNQYLEIIKANNQLKEEEKEVPNAKKEAKKLKAIQSLKFRVSTFYNNSQSKAKHPTNGRPIKGLKERLTGKEGQIRNNLMGKRSTVPDTPIMMFYTGIPKRADQIVAGDVIVGDDGLPRKVKGTITGESLLYKVKQSYGDDYRISCEHILTLKYCGHANIHWRKNIGKYGGWFMKWYDRVSKSIKSVKIGTCPSVSKEDAEKELKEYIKYEELEENTKYNWCPSRKKHGTWRLNYTKNGVKKSKEIQIEIGKTKDEAFNDITLLKNTINIDPIIDIHVEDYLKLSKTEQRLMLGIKLNTPIKWEKKNVNLDPRILGMWLGDGNSGDSRFTSIDIPIINYCKKWTEDNGGKFTHIHPPDKILHHGMSYCNFPSKLREYNLVNNKHIPEDYIINDEQTRLLVLAGLIDTDGSVEQDGTTIRITQCNEHKAIIDGAKRIAHSLGFRATVHVRKTSWESNGKKLKGEAIELTISGRGLEKIPTLLPHKKCKSSTKDMSSYKIEIEEIGVGKFCGIEVDQNNRFLLGDFTITHNCEFSGRTVIGPDPNLPFGWMGMPRRIAEDLTIPVRITTFNKEKMEKLVNDGKANFLIKDDGKTKINLKYAMYRRGTELLYGDIVIRGKNKLSVINGNIELQNGDKIERKGEILEKIFYPQKKRINLVIGDEVHRHLQDGDTVLLNRQPTLHTGSMMAFKIRIHEAGTFTMNLATTKSFNADFDGDEIDP